MNSERGKQIFHTLIEKSDIALHNFTPGTPLVEDLTYTHLKEINDKVIVAALSGYGRSGPYANQACFDATTQAQSRGMLITVFPGDPPLKTSITFIDISTG